MALKHVAITKTSTLELFHRSKLNYHKNNVGKKFSDDDVIEAAMKAYLGLEG